MIWRVVKRQCTCLVIISFSLAIMASPTPAQVGRPSEPRANDAQVQQAPPAPGSQTQGSPQSPSQPSTICGLHHLSQCLKDIGKDQAGIWTSPLRIRSHDAIWLVPFGGATAEALYYDADAQRELGNDSNRIDISSKIAAFGSPWTTMGEGAALYAVGSFSHDEHLTETGRLS